MAKADRLAFARRDENLLVALKQPRRDQLVAFVEADRDDAPRQRTAEHVQRALLHRALLRDHHDELVRIELFDRTEGLHFFARLQVQQVGHVFALACRADIRKPVDLQPVDPAEVREHEDVGVR